MTHSELRLFVEDKIRSWRSILLLLDRGGVQDLEDTVKLEALVRSENKEELKEWIKNHPSLDLGEMTINRLKVMAKELQVYNYSRKSRLELIRAIKERQNEQK